MITTIDSKSTVKIIRLKYIMALSIIVILVISSHLIMEKSNSNAEFDSRIINIAGRQRMLSQKITKCVLGIYNSKTSVESDEYGDKLIKGVANIRQGDLALRYGGDEFVIVLKYCNYDCAKIILDRIVFDLEILNKTKLNPFKIEISFGIVEYDEQKYSDEIEFINSADAIMYENKLRKKSKTVLT